MEMEKIHRQALQFFRSNQVNLYSSLLSFGCDDREGQRAESQDSEEDIEFDKFCFVEDLIEPESHPSCFPELDEEIKIGKKAAGDDDDDDDNDIKVWKKNEHIATALRIVELNYSNSERIENAKLFGEMLTFLQDICLVYRCE